MRFQKSCVPAVLTFCCIAALRAQNAPSHTVQDTSPHTIQMIPVENGVTLEVLDWGRHRTVVGFAGG
jgi:hypothetical protein